MTEAGTDSLIPGIGVVPARKRGRRWITGALLAVLLVIVAFTAMKAYSFVGQTFGRPGTIPAGYGAWGIAISPDGRMAYVADSGMSDSGGPARTGHTITPVNLATGTAGTPIQVPADPTGLAITPDGRKLYVLQWMWADAAPVITPVDLATGTAQAPLRFPGGAFAMRLSPDGRILYVITGPNLVVPVDVASDREGRPFRVPGNSGYLAITPDGKTLFVDNGDPSTSGPFTVTPVDVRTGRAGHPIPVAMNPTEMAVTPDGRTLYVAGNDNDDGPDSTGPWSLIPISLATSKVGRPLSLSSTPDAMAISPDGRTVYIGNDDDTITPVSTSTGRPGAAIHTGPAFPADYPGPVAIAIAPGGRTLYATDDDQLAIVPIGG